MLTCATCKIVHQCIVFNSFYIFLSHFTGAFVFRVPNESILVFSCSISRQMSIICWCRIANTSFTKRINVAKVVYQLLNLICTQITVVPQYTVMGWFFSTLQMTKNQKYIFLNPHLLTLIQQMATIYLPNNKANPNSDIIFQELAHLKSKKKMLY